MEEMQNTNEWVQANTNTTGSEVVMNTVSNVTNDESPLGKLMGALGDLLLNNDDFTYQMMRQSCDYINENIDLSEVDTSSLASSLHEEVKDSVLDELDYSRIIDGVHEDIDYREIARMVTDDYLDISDIADRVEDQIEGTEIARHLLNQYDPTNLCSTGQAFTNAVAQAVKYLVVNDSDMADVLTKSLNLGNVEVQNVDDVSDPSQDEEVSDGISVSDDFVYNLIKRIVNDLISQYVSTFNSDPYMRIRMEAKAFDIYHEMKKGN